MAQMRVFSAIFLLVLLLVSAGDTTVEARRTCESRSQRFKGLCFSYRNCARVCETEGFRGGRCRGFMIRRCFCTKPC